MKEEQRIEIMESVLSRQIAWVQAPESRIALILPVTTVMLTVLGALASENCRWNWYEILLTALAAVLLIVSLTFVASSVFPSLSGPKGSVIYFGGVVSMKRSEYREKLTSLDENEYKADLANQIHRNAEIAARKYKCVKWALIFMFIAFIPWLASAGIFFLSN